MDGGQIRALVDFVYDASTAEGLDQFRLVVTAGIRSVVGADLASYTEVDLETRTVIAPLDPQVDARDQLAAFGRLAHQHPLVIRNRATAETISDHLTARRFHALELYADVFGPLGAEDQLAISLLPPHSPVQIGIALNRSRATFTAADRSALEMLRPVLTRAYCKLIEERRRRQIATADHASLPLTSRQRDVLALVAEGASNKQIAHALGISRRTVENHLYAVYRQLDVNNRTAASSALALRLSGGGGDASAEVSARSLRPPHRTGSTLH